MSLLMLSRRRRCEGCDASQHALCFIFFSLRSSSTFPSYRAHLRRQRGHEEKTLQLWPSLSPCHHGDAPLRACVDMQCGHPRIPPRRRSLTASVRRGRARALAAAGVAARPLADPLPLTPVLQPAKALSRRESLGHLPLVILL